MLKADIAITQIVAGIANHQSIWNEISTVKPAFHFHLVFALPFRQTYQVRFYTGPTAEAQPASELPAQPAIANPAMHCQLCNVGFNSAVHAKQHYEGKNHAKKLKLSQPPATIPAAMIAVTTVDATLDQYKPTLVGPFVCELCDVSMTSQPQLDAHLQGKPHRTKVERTNKLAAFGEVPNILASPGGKRDNYSIYRTPSGQLYCSFCNISVDSDHQFGQHLESKKHKSKQKSSSSKPIFK